MTHRSASAVVIAAGLACGACARVLSTAAAPPGPIPSPDTTAAQPAPAAPDSGVLAAAPGVPPLHLTVREKAAQLVMPWIAGDYWATDAAAMDSALHLAADDGVGGFIVGVSASPFDVAEKLNALQRAARVPLLIASDLESGLSARVRGGTAFPGNMALGATDRELDAYEVGRVVALEGRAIGIHLDFAPVLDVNNNPRNPIINVRSFGENPQRVAELGDAFIRGLREHGMLSTAKHFPGHGDTGTDSHIALPAITGDRPRLDSIELVPFRAAVREGTDAVMAGHLSVPGLAGPDAPPATLSPVVLDTLLRGDLGFRGLIVTDALNMGAVVGRYGAAQAAVRALAAGADILLMPVSARATIDAVVDAVASGAVSEARLDSSVARVLAAKARLGLFRQRLVDVDRVAQAVGTSADAALAQDISQRSLVLVKDSIGLVPLPAARRHKVLIVAYGDENSRDVGAGLAGALRGSVDTIRALRLWPASGPASFDSVRAAAAGAGAVLLVAASRPTAWRPDAVDIPDGVATLIGQMAAAGAPVLAVSLGSPYVLAQIPAVSSFLAAWSDTDPMERAVARALLGLAPVTGRLPVSLPPAWPAGSGILRGGPAAPPRAGAGGAVP